ncbi:MAG: zinc ribbon domain-containing protein [Fimbriimonadaceae bacterium]|nr:zinc ribbon domain-containing protein [Fimbriimonadaceae bacterium]
MPFFEYKCAGCEQVFTLLQKRDAERSGHECPECGSHETERVFSTFAAAVAGPKSSSSAPAAAGHGCGAGCCCHR